MQALIRKRVFDNFESFCVVDGMTVYQVVESANIPADIFPYIRVTINGEAVPFKMWKRVRPNSGTTLMIQVLPYGGSFGQIFKVVAVLAVTIVATYFAGPVGLGYGTALAAGIGAAAGIATSLVLNSLIPPPGAGSLPSLDNSSSTRKKINAVTAQSNVADPYGPCIKPYGNNRIFPRVAAQPYSFFNNNDSYLVVIYDFGIGDIEITESTLKIGESALNNFENVQYRIVKNFNGDIFNYYVNDVFSEGLAVNFANTNDSAIRTTQQGVDFFQVDIIFPQGLAGIDSGGNFVNNEVFISLEYRETGTNSWKKYYETDFDLDPKFKDYTVTYENMTIGDFSPESSTVYPDGKYYEHYPKQGDGVRYSWEGVEYVMRYYHIDYTTNRTHLDLQIGDQYIFRNTVYTVVSKDSNYSYLDKTIRIYLHGLISGYGVPASLDGNFEPLKDNGVSNFRGVIKRYRYDNLNISDNSTDQFYSTVTIYPNEGAKQFDIRMTKTNEILRGHGVNNYTDFQWGQLKSFVKTDPINTKVPHTFLELKIKASDQLSGRVENLSAECWSNLDVYNSETETWEKQITDNPAWIFTDILTGDLNQRAISKNSLDVESLVRWADYCDTNRVDYYDNSIGLTCNFVLDSKSNLRELLSNVCSTGRAAIDTRNGKYGVIIDEERTVPVQIFSDRNFSNFSGSRSYLDKPHGIKCKYVDPISNWQINEVVAYDDGYDEENASIFEEMEFFGVTNEGLAWRQGRYFLAHGILRQENISIQVGIDNLACTRGDLVRLVSTVMKSGGVPSRVKSINGNNVTLDDDIFDNSSTYQIEVRHLNGDIIIYDIDSLIDTKTVEVSDVSKFQIGDLVIFGESEKTSEDYIVKSIIPDSDFNAKIVLVEYAPEIFEADQGTIPDYSPVTLDPDQTLGSKPGKVQDLSSSYSITCSSSEKRYKYSYKLFWEPPLSSLVENYEIYITVSGQTVLAGITKSKEFLYFIDNENLNKDHEFRVVAVSGTGEKLNFSEMEILTLTPYQDDVPPGDIQNFYANILSERIELEWDLLDDCDIEKYVIKFFPETSGGRWSTSQRVAEVAASTSNKSVPLKNGTYFIKAVDWAGNYSVNSKSVITTIPELDDISFIQEIGGPVWDGTRDKVSYRLDNSDETIILAGSADFQSFYDYEGYFYFDEIIDLGDVYKVRFESEIIASGFNSNSLIKNWPSLDVVDPIAGGFFEDSVNAEVQIRVKADGDFMSDWATLSDVNFLAFGTEQNSGPWKKLTIGDFTGQKFQMRIKLTTKDLSMSPIVYGVKIKAYFPPRTISGKNAQSGSEISFSPAFKEVPSFRFTTMENLQAGDFHEIIIIDEEKFKVQFYDVDGLAVTDRYFDWIATGYGTKYTSNGDLIFK